jgi:hypothetical protein
MAPPPTNRAPCTDRRPLRDPASPKLQMSMSRRALGEGDRTLKDRDQNRRGSRARTMTASVDRPMGSASLRSTTTPASSRAMARASARHSAPSVEAPCSPRSRTTVRLASCPGGPGAGPCLETLTDEGPARTMALSYLKAANVATRVWSIAPSQPLLARHVGVLVVRLGLGAAQSRLVSSSPPLASACRSGVYEARGIN